MLNTETLEEEGAWGAGTRFVERGNWAMYFTYEVSLLCGGSTSKCVFVTSTSHTGDLDGLSGADAICQGLADAAGSLAAPGTYKAWLSTPAAWPADGTRFTQAAVPYKLVDGTTVANDFTDLTTCEGSPIFRCLQHPIDTEETGENHDSVGGSRGVWTGTSPDGQPFGADCMAWSDGSGTAGGLKGASGGATPIWSRLAVDLCSNPALLYCFQQ